MKTNKLALISMLLLLAVLACQAASQGVSQAGTAPAAGETIVPGPTSSDLESVALPAEEPDMQVRPLDVKTVWFYQNKDSFLDLNFIFLVENPNKNAIVTDSEYDVTAHDAAGTAVAVGTARVGVIFPGETQPAFSSGLTWKDEAIHQRSIVDRLEVTPTKPGEGHAYKSASPFATSQVMFFPDADYPEVTGLLQNRLADVDLDAVSVIGIAYDDQGNIIAAGMNVPGTYVPAGGSTAVVAVLHGYGTPAKVRLFPYIGFLWGLKKASHEPEPVQLVKAGVVSRVPGQASYGFVIKNTDPVDGRMDINYSVTGFDQNGSILAVETGSQSIMFPGEQLGFTNGLHLPPDTSVARVEVQVRSSADPHDAAGFKAAGLSANPITVEGATFVPGDPTGKVTCTLKSLWSKDLTAITLNVLGYDENGVLVNSAVGTDYITVPAGGQTQVEIEMSFPQKPAKLEVYPIFTGIPQW